MRNMDRFNIVRVMAQKLDICCPLSEVRRQQVVISAAPKDSKGKGKPSDIQGPLRIIQNNMKLLWNKADLLDSNIAALRKAFIEAAKSKYSSKLKALQQIESKLGVLNDATRSYDEALNIYTQLQDRFGKNPGAAKAIKECQQLVKRLGGVLAEAKEVVGDIAEKHAPIVLSEEDDLFSAITESILESIEETNSSKPPPKPRIIWDYNYYMVGSDKAGILRFAVFCEIKNMPLLDTTRKPKTVYIVFCTDMRGISKATPSGNKITGTFSPLEMYVTDKIVNPINLSGGHIIKSVKTLESSLSYRAQVNGWRAFSGTLLLRVDPNERIKKLSDSLHVLGESGVKIKIDWPIAQVGIPKTAVKYSSESNTGIDPNWWMAMFNDLKRVLELPPAGAIQLFKGDLLVKSEGSKPSPKGKLEIFKFRLEPISPEIRRRGVAQKLSTPADLIAPTTEDIKLADLPEESFDFQSFMKDLKDELRKEGTLK